MNVRGENSTQFNFEYENHSRFPLTLMLPNSNINEKHMLRRNNFLSRKNI